MTTSKKVRGVCRNGHPAIVWGSPLMLEPGQVARWGASPLHCHCGTEIRGGGWL